MTTKHYVVLVKEDVDLNQFWTEMETGVSTSPYMPNRPVTIINSRELFPRLCEYELTDAEAVELRKDIRVAEVDIPVDQNNEVVIGPMSVVTGNFSRNVSTSWSSNINWGLVRHSNVDSKNNSTAEYQYTLDGTGVDVLISDSGIQVDHPEFTDSNGVSRVKQIEWGNIYAPLQSKGGYVDNDGHGTNVAGIATGKTYGWAKNSDIYSLYAPFASPSPVLDHFEGILRWHRTKNNNRPTVVNMSWGYFRQKGYGDVKGWLGTRTVSSIYYRNNKFTIAPGTLDAELQNILNRTGLNLNKGMPFENQASDYGIQMLAENGIIVCHCAGNIGYKNDISTGTDYNNYLELSDGNIHYYHRGCSPKSPKSISVGAIDTGFYFDGREQRVGFSCAGPGVDIFAAGVNIVSAGSSRVVSNPTYPANASFKVSKHSGTSQASPQIAGMCALYLQVNPTASPEQVKAWLTSNANTSALYKAATDDYANDRSLYGTSAGTAYLKMTENVISNKFKPYAKDQSGTWKPVNGMYAKQNATNWTEIQAGYIKTESGWKQTYKKGA